MWETSYLRFAQQAITNVAQQFTPSQFWTQRHEIEKTMLSVVNKTLIEEGHAEVVHLQLRAVGFQRSYEQVITASSAPLLLCSSPPLLLCSSAPLLLCSSAYPLPRCPPPPRLQTITNIQLQEQLKVTKSYQLEVTRVEKEVDLIQSETDALVVEIDADAARGRAVIEGEANAKALQREQETKAFMYQQLREHLGWTSQQFLQYIKVGYRLEPTFGKGPLHDSSLLSTRLASLTSPRLTSPPSPGLAQMKSLNSQNPSNVVVGVNAIGSVPP